MLKKILKYIGSLVLVYVLLCLATPFNKTLRNRSVKNQINYLSQILDNAYDDKLQNQFPEGKIFSNALLALSIIDYCEKNDNADQNYSRIVDNCIKRIQSESALEIFNPNIKPKYGMFYNGWSNYVFTSYMQSELFQLSQIPKMVIEESKIIEDRLIATLNDSLRILDSYVDASWPADNLIGTSSFSDKDLQQKWIKTILEASTHPSGLIHHSSSKKSKIRGSSSAMIIFSLNACGFKDINAYNDKFKNIFIDEYLGVQLVQENENGSNDMDVDSGPVVFGYGASATIMNIKTQGSLGNPKSKFTWAAMNLIALPINIFKKKYYLMKKEPMLDLFMLWGSTEL